MSHNDSYVKLRAVPHRNRHLVSASCARIVAPRQQRRPPDDLTSDTRTACPADVSPTTRHTLHVRTVPATHAALRFPRGNVTIVDVRVDRSGGMKRCATDPSSNTAKTGRRDVTERLAARFGDAARVVEQVAFVAAYGTRTHVPNVAQRDVSRVPTV